MLLPVWLMGSIINILTYNVNRLLKKFLLHVMIQGSKGSNHPAKRKEISYDIYKRALCAQDNDRSCGA